MRFDNSGTVAASGSDVTLTINTGGHTVLNAASGTLVAENDATLAIVSNLTNHGAMDAGTSASSANGASTGTLDLGEDGGTESMTDTGTIDIWGDSDLAIGGNYSVTGSVRPGRP